MTTLFEFMSHKFPLEKLSVLSDLNGAYFSEIAEDEVKHEKYLDQAQQSKIEDCQLTLHVIKPTTQDRVIFDLFDRVNRGGTRLNEFSLTGQFTDVDDFLRKGLRSFPYYDNLTKSVDLS